MEETKPIKRSPQLTPLSHEHHDGLLFIRQVRDGLKKSVSNDQLREYALWYWKEHIKAHFFDEEKIVLPYVPEDMPMAVKIKKEHADIRELILSLDKEAESATLAMLCDLLTNHIRFEERKFFVYLEENLSQDQLNEIFNQLTKTPVCKDEWKNPFWKTS